MNRAQITDAKDHSIEHQIQETLDLIETRLQTIIPSDQTWPARLHEAQRHALLSPGKRFRPLLTYFIVKACGVTSEISLNTAIDTGCVVEMVHAASLILDDLPCMDDADLRRNQPTTHIAFDESTAILTATALLNRAFGVLSRQTSLPSESRIQMIDLLSHAVGSKGLIAGQMADLANTSPGTTISEIERLNMLKTGALFDFAVEAAAIIGESSNPQRAKLNEFSYNLGLAFQLLDDLKDVIMDEKVSGKTVMRDTNKTTVLAIDGENRAKKRIQAYIDQAKHALQSAQLTQTDILIHLIDKQFECLISDYD